MVSTFSICMQSLVEIGGRTPTGDEKMSSFFCHGPVMGVARVLRMRGVFSLTQNSVAVYGRILKRFSPFLAGETALLVVYTDF